MTGMQNTERSSGSHSIPEDKRRATLSHTRNAQRNEAEFRALTIAKQKSG